VNLGLRTSYLAKQLLEGAMNNQHYYRQLFLPTGNSSVTDDTHSALQLTDEFSFT
jgi:hypothetical protein